MSGWIVTNAAGDKFRTWDQHPVWTSDREIATRYVRREDAERAHAEDEDAWCIVEFDSIPAAEREKARITRYLLDTLAANLKSGHVPLSELRDAWNKGDFVKELYAKIGPTAPTRRVRHKKRGTVYEVLGEGTIQVSTDVFGREIGLGLVRERMATEGFKMVVYRNPDTGELWLRFPDEFRDGRFEDVP